VQPAVTSLLTIAVVVVFGGLWYLLLLYLRVRG
jgi:hypothetical protein